MRRALERELLDAPVASTRELEENFDDIERLNRLLGATRSVRSAVLASAPRSVLDVGAGSGDALRAIAAADRSRSIERLTGVDTNTAIVELARRRSPAWPRIEFMQADATALPFEDASFDVAICNLTLHHLDRDVAVTVLRELRRVSRSSPIVTDLCRSTVAYVGARVIGCCTRNRMTRHDAPLSVRRAYTREEARELATAAGWRRPRARGAGFYRYLLTDAG